MNPNILLYKLLINNKNLSFRIAITFKSTSIRRLNVFANSVEFIQNNNVQLVYARINFLKYSNPVLNMKIVRSMFCF